MAPVRFHSLIVIKQAGEFAVPRNIAMIAAAEYHLLFGLLALQNGIINQGAARRRVPGLDAGQVPEPGRPP